MMPTQESAWNWLTNQHICDFSTPTTPETICLMHVSPCTKATGLRCSCGCWRSMCTYCVGLWGWLRWTDGFGTWAAITHVHSRCCRKRGGGRAPCHLGTLSLDHLPACSRDTLEHAVCSTKDTIALEHLVWAIYDNQLGPGKSLSLSGYESYRQVLQCLVDRAFWGLQACCPAHTHLGHVQTSRKSEVGSHCAAEVAAGLRSIPWLGMCRQEFAGGDQVARGWGEPLDPEVDALKWMKEHQHSYMDTQLDFWLLLWPLTDGGEELSWHLACRLLSVWHWVSALDPPICPPAPSSLNIGHWLWDDPKVDEKQWWIEA